MPYYACGDDGPGEWTTAVGAQRLAEKIKAHWAEMGVPPPTTRVYSEGFHESMRCVRCVVVSDMVDGWPPALRAQKLGNTRHAPAR